MKISFTGDVMCQSPLLRKWQEQPFDFAGCFSPCAGLFAASDITVVNLETPVAGSAMQYTFERYCFNSPDEFASGLHALSKSLLAAIANNHSLDRGMQGLFNTLGALRRENIPFIGASEKPSEESCFFMFEKGGLRVAFLNGTYGTNMFANHEKIPSGLEDCIDLLQPQEEMPGSVFPLHMNDYSHIANEVERLYGDNEDPLYRKTIKPRLDRMERGLRSARAAGADIVILLLHTGGQNCPYPDAYSEMLVRYFSGLADVIICHHPHVPQKAVLEGSTPVFYSLGNFLFNPSTSPDANRLLSGNYSLVPHLRLEKKNGRLVKEFTLSITRSVEDPSGMVRAVPVTELYRESSGRERNILCEDIGNVLRAAGLNPSPVVMDEYPVPF